MTVLLLLALQQLALLNWPIHTYKAKVTLAVHFVRNPSLGQRHVSQYSIDVPEASPARSVYSPRVLRESCHELATSKSMTLTKLAQISDLVVDSDTAPRARTGSYPRPPHCGHRSRRPDDHVAIECNQLLQDALQFVDSLLTLLVGEMSRLRQVL